MSGHHDHAKHVTPDEHDAPDAWHQHSADERPQKAHAENIPAGLVVGVGLGMFALLVATVVIVYGYYTWYSTNLLQQQEATGLESESRKVREDVQNEFKTYAWVQPGSTVPEGTIQIPLELAVKKVTTQYANQK